MKYLQIWINELLIVKGGKGGPKLDNNLDE